MNPITDEIKILHDNANKLLLNWLEHPPIDRRQQQAFKLLAEAVQLLHAATINLGIAEAEDE